MTLINILILIAVLSIVSWLFYELNGAWNRWRNGQPILKSAFDAQVLADERERRARRKKEVYAEYEIDCSRLDRDPTFYREFKEYWDWTSIRAEVIREWRKEGEICPACGVNLGGTRKLHVDHISPRSTYPHMRYLKSNLRVLCSRCNLIKHDYDGDDWEEVIEQRKKEKKQRARKNYYKKRKAKLAGK